MKSLGVFCGAKTGKDPIYMEVASELGRQMLANDIALVYGGGNEGIMRAVCDPLLEGEKKGHVTAVIPQFMLNELHDKATKIDVVETMHERKMKMFEEAEGFVALPGGIGTLDEITEMITWAALGLNKKPVALLNVKGYFNHYLAHWKHMYEEGFLGKEIYQKLIVAETPEELLRKMRQE